MNDDSTQAPDYSDSIPARKTPWYAVPIMRVFDLVDMLSPKKTTVASRLILLFLSPIWISISIALLLILATPTALFLFSHILIIWIRTGEWKEP